MAISHVELLGLPKEGIRWPGDSKEKMRKLLIASAITLIVLIIAGLVTLRYYSPTLKTILRTRTEAYLSQRFQSTLEFSSFDMSIRPRIHVAIHDLVLRHHGRTDVPPLVQFHELAFNVSFRSLFKPAPDISSVQISGLKICIPPRYPGGPPMFKPTDQDLAKKYPAVIGEIHTDDAFLVMLPRDPAKNPHEFLIHHLFLREVGFGQPTHFHAILTNPVPKGDIDCVGDFGPWNGPDPAATPVSASFTFDHADLGTIKGIKGILTSKGKFGGPLDYLSVEGYTDTHDYALRDRTSTLLNSSHQHTSLIPTTD
jgi:hypothetical protein